MAGSKSRPVGICRPSDRDQLGLEGLAARLGEGSQQVPERGRSEGHPLTLALDDQPHGHALHPAGRKPRADFPPQQRGNIVAVKAIDDPADLLGPHQIVVDLARALQRVEDRLLGDFVENEPVDGHFGLQDLAKVPTDGLSLAVFVRGQIEFAGPFQQALEFANLLTFGVGDDVNRLESVVYIDAQIGPVLFLVLFGDFLGPLRQVADMADAGLDGVAAAKKLADRPGFCRRFDDHQRQFRRRCWISWPCYSWKIWEGFAIVAPVSIRTIQRELALHLRPSHLELRDYDRWRPAAAC